MKFRISPANRATRVMAALILLCFGVGLIIGLPMPKSLAGVALTTLAVWVTFTESMAFARERRDRPDPYDLSLLKHAETYQGPSRDDPDQAVETPSWETEEGDALYCHRCDASMPTTYSICPKCGSVLS